MPQASLAASRASLNRRPKQRVRVALKRWPVFRWIVAGVAGLLTLWSLNATVSSTTEAAATYGNLVEVVVANRTIQPGELLDPSSVRVTALPAALVPPNALTEIPFGQSARSLISAGEAVITERLAPLGVNGLAAAIQPGERAIAVPVERNRIAFEIGMEVDVLQTLDPFSVGASNATSTVVAAARVIALEEMAITIAVPTNAANRVATALASSVVTLVITPG